MRRGSKVYEEMYKGYEEMYLGVRGEVQRSMRIGTEVYEERY
jgi:hypothetical protein